MSLKSLHSFFQENEWIPFNTWYYPIILAFCSCSRPKMVRDLRPDRKGKWSKDRSGGTSRTSGRDTSFFAIAQKSRQKTLAKSRQLYSNLTHLKTCIWLKRPRIFWPFSVVTNVKIFNALCIPSMPIQTQFSMLWFGFLYLNLFLLSFWAGPI